MMRQALIESVEQLWGVPGYGTLLEQQTPVAVPWQIASCAGAAETVSLIAPGESRALMRRGQAT